MMTHGEYCVNVCHGQCCKVYSSSGVLLYQCQYQDKESGACTRFEEWKDEPTCQKLWPNELVESVLVHIGRGSMPTKMMEKCCYAHPELLEGGN